MIYKVSFYSLEDSSKGFQFTTNKAKAKKLLSEFKKNCASGVNPNSMEPFSKNFNSFDKEQSEIKTFPTPKTLKQWITFLNHHANHPDNG